VIIIGAVAELERNLIIERVRAGMTRFSKCRAQRAPFFIPKQLPSRNQSVQAKET